jgi:chromosome segregation ATPase
LSVDKNISEIKQSIADVEGRIEAEKARISSRITELRDEQTRCSANLAQERRRISDLAAEPRSDSFFKRLFAGNSKTSTKDTETKVQELESRLRALPDEILEQQKRLKSVGMGSPGSSFAEEWRVLDSLQSKLQALESERLERVQLVKEREQATASIAEAISRIHV